MWVKLRFFSKASWWGSVGTVVCLGLKARINVVLASQTSEAKSTLHSRFTNTLPEWQDLCSGAGGLQNLTHIPFPALHSLPAPPAWLHPLLEPQPPSPVWWGSPYGCQMRRWSPGVFPGMSVGSPSPGMLRWLNLLVLLEGFWQTFKNKS